MIYRFNRYRLGVLMAEGVKIEKARSLEEACAKAASLTPAGDVLVIDKITPDDGEKAPAWDGKGERPPVGTRCMKGYEEVLILAHADVGSSSGPAVVYQVIKNPTFINWVVANVFTPIRSAEDKAVDAMADVLGQLPMNATNKTDLASHLYHAVREGRIPGWFIKEGE